MLRTAPMATALLVLLSSAPAFAAYVCGDVNQSQSVSSTDALLVLKKAVGQSVTISCPAIDDLEACQDATCGNDYAEYGELCDGVDLQGFSCATEAPDTPYGKLACGSDCGSFDTSGCSARFDASGDTIVDHATGLEWEKKTGTVGTDQYCDFGGDCSDIHSVNNLYRWGSDKAPNLSAFTDFIGALNGSNDSVCHAGHCDWRLPTREELAGVRNTGVAGCGSGGPCLDPAFSPDGAQLYWSSSTWDEGAGLAWPFHTGASSAGPTDKPNAHRVRAVRNAD